MPSSIVPGQFPLVRSYRTAGFIPVLAQIVRGEELAMHGIVSTLAAKSVAQWRSIVPFKQQQVSQPRVPPVQVAG